MPLFPDSTLESPWQQMSRDNSDQLTWEHAPGWTDKTRRGKTSEHKHGWAGPGYARDPANIDFVEFDKGGLEE